MSKDKNIFTDLANKFGNNPVVALIGIFAWALFLFGLNNFAEDTYSSYVGIQMIEKQFGVTAASWNATYFFISIIFQALSVIFMYVFVIDREEYWWASIVALGSQAVDFAADIWYRSGGNPFLDTNRFVASFLLTFLMFTVGSEIALMLGFGFTRTLTRPAVKYIADYIMEIINSITDFVKGFLSYKSKPQQQSMRMNKGDYSCVCGKSFNNPRSLSDHVKSCQMFIGYRGGNASRPTAPSYSFRNKR